MTSRQLRAAEILRQALSEVFNSGTYITKDLFEKSITITNITISPDLQKASVFVELLGAQIENDHAIKGVVASLNESSPKIRAMIAKKIAFKRIPNIHFKYDDSFSKAKEIIQAIEKLSEK